MQTSISLIYNSNAGNGIMGMGWQLSGIPYISRDTTYAMQYRGNDHFIGPAGRLVELNPDDKTYPIKKNFGETYWHYENETFSRFKMTAADKAGEPTEWIEHKPDGTKYFYGSTSDSRLEGRDDYEKSIFDSNHSTRYCIWGLSKVEDIFGNYYTIEYQKFDEHEAYNHSLYPKRIIYTRGNYLNTFKIIYFKYENRDDINSDYQLKTYRVIKKRLSEIIIKAGVDENDDEESDEGLVKKYILNYQQTAQHKSILSSVKEVSKDNDEINFIEFEWNDGKLSNDLSFQNMSSNIDF